jgi:uncharacterized protein (DUF305 family)
MLALTTAPPTLWRGKSTRQQSKANNHEILHQKTIADGTSDAGICCALLVWPAQAQAPASTMTMPVESSKSDSACSQDMQKSMMSGMDKMQKMPMSGNTDKDFAMMMKMHHQQGVEMVQVQLKNGKSPVMKKMAKKIITAQNKEIAQFDQWLTKQK